MTYRFELFDYNIAEYSVDLAKRVAMKFEGNRLFLARFHDTRDFIMRSMFNLVESDDVDTLDFVSCNAIKFTKCNVVRSAVINVTRFKILFDGINWTS